MSAAEYARLHRPKPKAKKTGPSGALSSPVAGPFGSPDDRPQDRVRAAWATAWRGRESAVRATLHYKGRTRVVCLDGDGLRRWQERALRVVSHDLHIYLTDD